ncbi:MAG TPA: hypothetical protein VK589_07215 [Chryseolinea sp.]|nr:hypothetical protein [Chryseolinea sp.]
MSTSIAKADCLACWELRKVEITLKNGETRTGFVFWNEAWLDETIENWKELRNKFPENFMALHRSKPGQNIYLLTKLTTVKNDSLQEFKAITKEDQLGIRPDEVTVITELDQGLKKYEGAGKIPVYTLEELNKLNTNPYATYQYEGAVSDDFFLSYNKKITRQQLKKISENNEIGPDELTKMGVIIVTIGYD